jgi:RHS repeat-associated protein
MIYAQIAFRVRFFRLTAALLAFFIVFWTVSPAFAAEATNVYTSGDAPSQTPASTDVFTTGTQTPSENSLSQQPTGDSLDSQPESSSLSSGQSAMSLQGDVGTNIPLNSSTIKQIVPDSNQNSGALNYDFPIVVPPGRNGLQPDLKLSYNNQNIEQGSEFGYGWSINIPYIERLNKKGVNKLYTEDYFNSSLTGELVSLGSGSYGSKVDNGEFLTYSLSSNVWTVTDKNGTVYKFGTNAAERQDSGSNVYKWMLQEVRDTNDNYIKYEYYKSNGQIYPSAIKYTGNGSTDGIFEVDFLRESRNDAVTVDKTGFAVTSSSRIYEIDIKVNGTWSKKYALAYSAGNNGKTSLLTSITESGQDDSSNVITLPATSFTYQTHATDWTKNTSWTMPDMYNNGSTTFKIMFADDTGKNKYGVALADVNGDSLPDLLQSGINIDGNQVSKIYINKGDGTGFAQDTNWSFPTDTVNGSSGQTVLINYNGTDRGVRFADVNGDGLADIVRSTFIYGSPCMQSESAVYINNGNGTGWTKDTNYVFPVMQTVSGCQATFKVMFADDTGKNKWGVDMADVNGDGLADIVQSGINIDGTQISKVYLNKGDGTGWAEDTNWSFPTDTVNGSSGQTVLISYMGTDRGVNIIDVNGDGLADIVRSTFVWGNPCMVTESGVYINNGTTGWTKDTNYSFPFMYDAGCPATFKVMFADDTGKNKWGVSMADVNGDNLPDILQSGINLDGNQISKVYLNNGDGSGWSENTGWQFPTDTVQGSSGQTVLINYMGTDRGVRFADLDGDGLPDLLRSNMIYGSPSMLSESAEYINNGKNVDEISRVTYPQGGKTDVTYTGTPQYTSSGALLNPNLPFTLQTVSQLVNDDGNGVTSTTNYKYEGGRFYYSSPYERKFSGFSKVTTTDAASNTTKYFYHQGNTSDSTHGEYNDDISKAGKMYRIEVANSSGNLYSKTIQKWDKYDLGSGRTFVKLANKVESTYDGDSSHKDKAVAYTYDNTYGNMTQKVEYGEVTGSDDGTFTDSGTDDFTTALTYVSTTSPRLIGLPDQSTTTDHGSTKVKESKYYYDTQTLGSATKGNLTKREDWKTGSTYVNVQKSYNSTYGTLASDTDQRGKVTSYSNDTYNLYPATVTDPLTHATSLTYDYSSGKVKQKTDPNSRVFQTDYDALDRVIAEKQPDYTTPSTLVTKTAYAYTNTSGAVSIHKTDNLDGSTARETYEYYDGLGRLLQKRIEAEGTNYEVTDQAYNNRALLDKVSLPYFSTGTSKTTATSTSSLYTTYAYDPMARVTTSTNNLGTTTNAYSDWKLTITDANSKSKDLYKDAYGNLNQVDEHNGASTYTTTYTYNYLGNLLSLTDALSNVRNFTYDGLGRRLTAQDLHASADTYFGSWTYTYDDAGNLTQTVDPNGNTINYTYDDINRQLLEKLGSTTKVTNSYDSGTDGIGHLTGITTGTLTQTNTYNPVGGLKSEAKVINSTTYTTNYTYDRLGNQVTVTNPDSSAIQYTYNSAGLLDSVQRKESGGSYTNVVSNFDYSPDEKPTTISYANGATTTNTYDSTKLYRLTAKVTTIASSSHAQDLAYTYDAVGNITQIIDASSTSTSKTANYTYDDLYRLTQAAITSVASGQSTYTKNYTYNAIGDITAGDSGTYTYAGNTGTSYANPHAVTATSTGSVSYTYDNNGNELTKGSSLTNTWDYNNRLTQSVAGSTTVTYDYDSTGQRIKYANGTTTTYYPSKSYNTDGTTPQKHIFALGMEIGVVSGSGGSVTVRYTHTDQLTGSNIITNSSDTADETLDYYPFGGIRIDSGSYSDQRKFAGQEYDSNTSLEYMNARYYDPATGRFTSQDPVFLSLGTGKLAILTNPQTLNSYSYADNNPLIQIDPTGQFSINVFGVLPNSVQVSIGNWANKAYQNNSVARFAMDHPYTAGAIIGVAGGAAVVTGVVASGGAITCGLICGSAAANTVIIGGSACASGACDKAQVLANQAQGYLGELNSGIVKNTQLINVGGRARIPDILDDAKGVIGDVKAVQYQSLTQQLKDFMSYAQDKGYQFKLIVDDSTKLSKPLQQAVQAINGTIERVKLK